MFEKLFALKSALPALSTQLEQYVVQNQQPYRANFRCVICGDSQKNRRKKRGYILEDNQNLFYHCHNCGAHMHLDTFLKQNFPDIHQSVMFSLMLEQPPEAASETTSPVVPARPDPLEGLVRVDQMGSHHPIRRYLESRLIPPHTFSRIYGTGKFYEWAQRVADKFSRVDLKTDHPRVIFPMRKFSGECFGASARAIDDRSDRYYTLKFSDFPKFFGLESISLSERVYVFEGAIDSLFIQNSVAFLGTDGDCSSVFPDKNQVVIILDNEPRNAEVVAKYDKYIAQGYTIVIWPQSTTQKDIAAMVFDGITPQEIRQIIDDNASSGLMASLRFQSWRRV